jgi:aldehyde:ferredoxin oxidoreductase
MNRLFGHAGFRLRVDLSGRQAAFEEIDAEYARKWVGGRGFNMEVFFREIPVDAAPRGPENKLIFGVGPVTGTSFPGSRINISGKSPHTGYLGDSNAGGHFSAEMKFAGIDQIVFEGRAERPVYVRIVDHAVEIREAAHLWGLDTWETSAAIRRECHDPDIQIACCGTAAVAGVSFGNIITNNARALGRTGMGTLMASKNLKAVAVSGSGAVRVAEPENFQKVVDFIFRSIYGHANFQERGITGTTNLIRLCQSAGILPTRHFQTGVFEKWLAVSGETVAAEYNVKRKACFGCVNPCSRYYVVPGGFDGAELRAEGPEYETLAGFTARVGNADLKIALKCAEVVNRAGVDSITATEVISWAQELFARGLLAPRDCDGLDLSWGNGRAVYELLLKIVANEGFGAVLAQGVVKASEALGIGRELCMEVKNLELFQADVRGLKAYGLGNAVASRGGDHQRADPFFEMSGRTAEAAERFGAATCAEMRPWEGKGRMVPWFEEMCALADSLSFCKIIGVSMEVVREAAVRDLFRFATGQAVDVEEMLRAGERIVNLERAILARYGLDRRHDVLPKRFREEQLPDDSGPAAGLVFENEALLDEYYPFRGWDPATGWPTKAKLVELGLEEAARDLERRGIALSPDYPRRPGDPHATTTERWAHLGKAIDDSTAYLDGRQPSRTPPEGAAGDEAMIPKRLLVDAGRCSGCRACEMACAFAHTRAYSPALARLHVIKLEGAGADRPIVCLRCARPPCAAVCPSGAIAQEPESRIVRVAADKCVGCGLCVEACVSGVIQLDPQTDQPLLCDLCGGAPECTKKCPTGALVYAEGRDHAAKRTRAAEGLRTSRQEAKRWAAGGTRPVDTPMRPPDPVTGAPLDPPEAYGGNPPPPFDRRRRPGG